MEEDAGWMNDVTGDIVRVVKPNYDPSGNDEYRAYLQGHKATERVGYPNVRDLMGIGKGEHDPERGLITRTKKKAAMSDARRFMKDNPLAGYIDLAIGKAEANVDKFEDRHADLEDEAWNIVEELLYHDLDLEAGDVPQELEDQLVNEIIDSMEAVARGGK